MARFNENGQAFTLKTPTDIPSAGGFLWNEVMLLQATCRGYVTSQFMQPEPSKYSQGPVLEAKTFMQPEQPYYQHHSGRFFYIKDEESHEVFSVPYEPVRAKYDDFSFTHKQEELIWEVKSQELKIVARLSLMAANAGELWQVKVHNLSSRRRKLGLYPYFPFGYRSWMHQATNFRPELNGIVNYAITPYQKVPDYYKNQHLKDNSYFLSSVTPIAWETRQAAFEGEGGLHNPSALAQTELSKGAANHCTGIASMQFALALAPEEHQTFEFCFGPALDEPEILAVQKRYLSENGYEDNLVKLRKYLQKGQGSVVLNSQNTELNHFVNHWLNRQVYYHGDVNRLTTDPQTRNYLQDNMGMAFIHPQTARHAIVTALSQQKACGEMPDGILLHPDAELKYINQVPHSDHCVWVPLLVQTYLCETNDVSLLQELVPYEDEEAKESIFVHVDKAMHWLASAVDERGLSYIHQGDWCDPMNMVGHKGKGVSAWLTLASAYCFKIWAEICDEFGQAEKAVYWRTKQKVFNDIANQYFWINDRYARGITDNGRVFGIKEDDEGKVFLNPQSWAMLSEAMCTDKKGPTLTTVSSELDTPHGLMMLAPAYTRMVEDIGRVTQKFPGTAENGSVYNHASVFFIYALYQAGETELAFQHLMKVITTTENMHARQQLPLFVPNYYRGAYHQFPEEAGRSSGLFNTGTVAWVYRIIIEELCGVKGCAEGLIINPKLPKEWPELELTREFRGASFSLKIRRCAQASEVQVTLDGQVLEGNIIKSFKQGQRYEVDVKVATCHSSDG